MLNLRDGVYSAIALDPGGTTGIAEYRAKVIHTPDGVPEYFDERFHHNALGPEPHFMQLHQYLEMMRTYNFHLVCESFQNRGIDKELVSAELIGVVKMFKQETDCIPYFADTEWMFWNTASVVTSKKEGGSFWTDEKLKKLDVWFTGMKHPNDAMKHLLQHLVFTMNRKDILARLK